MVQEFKESETFKTPGIDPIFDLYVAYGYVESLVRGGAKEITLTPKGISYSLQTDIPEEEFRRGLTDALEEMLALHVALARHSPREGGKLVSDADFSAGANINNVYWDSIPRNLKKAKERLEAGKLPHDTVTMPITLMPSAGKYMPKHFGAQGGNPIKVDLLNYALAWVGFHYYTPYVKYTKGDTTWVHIYQIAPAEEVDMISLLSLKDLKMALPHYYENSLDFLTNRRLALLYHLLHSESIGALEAFTKREFMIRSYTLEKSGNNQAVRSFGEEEIGRLMDFLYELKRRDFYHTVRFIEGLLRETTEGALAMIDAIMNERPEGFYTAINLGWKKGVIPSQEIITTLGEIINET
ncbi:type I-A CRISPR-associated protein Cas8a2/Csa4 [Thermococcus siculi]|uniref:Type I-A CRISPR-associated protein Cas8a2/Csa4 n=1 Tax=Thermococcus siculi TaxID=72803 RepID=A0A2Z2MLZ1_9EURY|nr:type I-A CRISPR-associated protein Cas8a2/Csa4 [Thermococcus siculi]ASJ08818.1 type I-A CRISPR-associated protein Cas8a2/Csa4 [Thermococcus siculi]